MRALAAHNAHSPESLVSDPTPLRALPPRNAHSASPSHAIFQLQARDQLQQLQEVSREAWEQSLLIEKTELENTRAQQFTTRRSKITAPPPAPRTPQTALSPQSVASGSPPTRLTPTRTPGARSARPTSPLSGEPTPLRAQRPRSWRSPAAEVERATAQAVADAAVSAASAVARISRHSPSAASAVGEAAAAAVADAAMAAAAAFAALDGGDGDGEAAHFDDAVRAWNAHRVDAVERAWNANGVAPSPPRSAVRATSMWSSPPRWESQYGAAPVGGLVRLHALRRWQRHAVDRRASGEFRAAKAHSAEADWHLNSLLSLIHI